VADIFERRIESFIREFKSTHEDRWNKFVMENIVEAKKKGFPNSRAVYRPKELQEQHMKLAVQIITTLPLCQETKLELHVLEHKVNSF